MTNDYLVECGFLVPIRRDSRLSDGKPHEATAWDWLYDELFDAFGVVRFSNVLEIADWRDPHGAAVHGRSRARIRLPSRKRELTRFGTC